MKIELTMMGLVEQYLVYLSDVIVEELVTS